MVDLSTTVCGVVFRNPVIMASGTFGFGMEYARLYPLSCIGGIATKALTVEPRSGNAGVRSCETPSGMLNAVGLQNPGMHVFAEEYLPWLRKQNTVIIANFAGNTLESYAEAAAFLDKTDVDMLELNISCPNVKEGGAAFGVYPDGITAAVTAVRKVVKHKPLVVKLSPNCADIAVNALAAQKAGADAVSLINTLTGMAVDWRRRRPVIANVTGGLSGEAIRPVALRMVYQAAKALKIPVIGMGGIASADDVLSFICVGASAVMVGAHNFTAPLFGKVVAEELTNRLEQCKIEKLSDLKGTLQTDGANQ
ncbi:MAG: dihydroorotate dehydrogenase [Clostridiales bacterium]|jgi:dihydroorotate dehydrogenase (NAD+) catalytic subunit|nr:dihydroorotate dehydrogenase [Clostridiales bacterium]